ncbi:CPBP family intramembrane glutamic endopeptidase [Streptococcus sp. H31]|uniref:CPBP family intramembrane glutamic endopeptidase n=1 Tax=Streptococcus huangxiaojuni TaxID=3237239 RepID=UPI0034A17A38
MINKTTREAKGRKLLLQGLVISLLFFLFSTLLKNLPSSKDSSAFFPNVLNFILSIGLAGFCYYLIKSEKIFDKPLQYSKSSRRLFTILICIFTIMFLLVFRVPFNILTILTKGLTLTVSTLLAAVAAGVFEELLVRGLMFSGLLQLLYKKNSRWPFLGASCLSALIFGVLHFINLTASPLPAVVQQVFYAAVFGLVFAALRIKYNNLWLPVIIHCLIDFQPAVTSGQVPAGNSWIGLLIVFLPLLILCLLVLSRFDQDYRQRAEDF